MSRYFITGATGFIGGHLARRLRAEGHDVVTIARDPARADDLRALGVQVHRGDITQPDTLLAPMTGADGVFHVAAWYSVGARDKSMARSVNVDGTRHVLEAMRDLGIAKGVYTSTVGVFGDTHGQMRSEDYAGPYDLLTEYDRTKHAAHYEVARPMQMAGLPLVIVQPGLVYGPGDTSAVRTTLRQYLTGKLAATPQGTAYCWAHVDDIVHGHMLAMQTGRAGENYIIAGPRHSLMEAFEIAERITGIKAPSQHPSPGVMKTLAAIMGVVERIAPVPEDYTYEGLRVVAGVTYLGDNAKARRELGYAPRGLEEGLRTTLQHEMQELGLGALAR
jgi:nucleoside-diphosphate-sugar epimerase